MIISAFSILYRFHTTRRGTFLSVNGGTEQLAACLLARSAAAIKRRKRRRLA